MRVCLFLLAVTVGFAQQPILYNRGTVNAGSLAPPGLPNAPIARGSIFTVFGERLGPAETPSLAFPLLSTLGGVSISVTQDAVTAQAFPIFLSPGQINAVMPSSVHAGLATLRLTYQNVKSNAITIEIADSAPGIFAVSGGGFGPGVVQNVVSGTNQPVNALNVPASRGQVIIIWGTGLGPVTFPDNVAPTAGNVATPVTVTIGGQPAAVTYSGRSPCCSGVDQIVVTVPDNAPFGCWVPVAINAGGVVSNTATMAIAPAGATTCDDPGNPMSKLVRTPGSQAFVHFEHLDAFENLETATPITKALEQLYSRFYTRPDSPFNFDPYMSYPPAGSCTLHQTSGDAFIAKNLRGALPASASLAAQPAQTFNNGTSANTIAPNHYAFIASTLGGKINTETAGMGPLAPNSNLTIDPTGPNEIVLPISPPAPPNWPRPNGLLVAQRNSPLTLSFTPGDPAAPTAILLYAYTAAMNATVEVQCLAAPGASSFTIPVDMLSNLPPSFRLLDGSYAELILGTLGLNRATTFNNALAANGLFLNSNWVSQTVVLQ